MGCSFSTNSFLLLDYFCSYGSVDEKSPISIFTKYFLCKIWGFHSYDYEEYLWSRVIHPPWRWRRYIPPKRLFKPNPHGATSQKTIFFKIFPVQVWASPVFSSWCLPLPGWSVLFWVVPETAVIAERTLLIHYYELYERSSYYRILMMVYNFQKYWVFGLYPMSWY
jgi:hypothetical protein